MPPKQSAIEAGEFTGRRSFVSRSTSIREAHALQKIIKQRFPIVYSHDNAREARIWAYVARCMALLSGMVVLLEAGEDDSASVLYRTLV